MIDVVCAIIRDLQGKVLVTQRSAAKKQALKMEFPGGKVEAGEKPETALIREIKEELNLEIELLFELPAHEHHYGDVSIRLIPFVCHITGGVLELNEHAASYWVAPLDLNNLDWAAADLPIVEEFLKAR